MKKPCPSALVYFGPRTREFGMKRLSDLVIVLAASPFWLPTIALLAVVVRLRLGSPVFFLQDRAGRGGRVFAVIKFRSMTEGCGPDGKLLPDAQRLPAFGRWLRATSLDELPELFNVLRGDMSLVGPRPLLARYLPRYSLRQARRHEVRPGITGLAQVMGRNAISWEEKFEWDVRYVETYSLWLDLRILLLTIGSVLFRRGISAAGEATMPEFLGSGTPLGTTDAPESPRSPSVITGGRTRD